MDICKLFHFVPDRHVWNIDQPPHLVNLIENVMKDIHQTVMCLGTDLDDETKTAPGSPDKDIGVGSDLLRGEDSR